VPAASEWLRDALEAMAWVAEERGLGGARSLDGLAWDLSIDSVWEAWIAAFAGRLGGRLGMTATPFAGARRALRWVGPVQSMGFLAPDVELRGAEPTCTRPWPMHPWPTLRRWTPCCFTLR
jgi:hypothetical protein